MNIDLRVTPWRSQPQNPGFVSEQVEARVDGVRAGYLRWVYLPSENVSAFYGDWQAYAESMGKAGKPERLEERRQIMLDWFVDKPTVAFARVFEEDESDEKDEPSEFGGGVNWRGKGIAMAMYDFAARYLARKGLSLWADSTQTMQAKKLWARLVAEHGAITQGNRMYLKRADLVPGGRADLRDPNDFDPVELARGIEVEQEHTQNWLLAREIAMDHLTEIPDYYTRLDRMESAAKTAATPKKYDHIDFTPPKGVADTAKKGLEYRQKASPSNRGGLTPAEASKEGIGSGVQRAVNLKNRDQISPDVIRQMVNFFARSEKNKTVDPKHKGEPWNDKGYVAWLIWGGDAGRAWATKVRDQMDAADEKAKTASRLVSAWGKRAYESNVEDSFKRTKQNLDKYLPVLRREVEDALETMDRAGDTPERWAEGEYWIRPTAVGTAYTYAAQVVASAAIVKQVPAKYRKLFDKARREFSRVRRFDRLVFFGKNIDLYKMLITVDSWPDVELIAAPTQASPDGESTDLDIGRIQVVNQTADDPVKTQDMVRKAVKFLRDSKVPNIEKALYGFVYIVGDVARKKTVAARYFPTKDVIEVILVKRFNEHSLRSLIHEFGHRYWRKFADLGLKSAWQRHHAEMTYATPTTGIVMPQVGDAPPYFKGKKVVDKSNGVVTLDDGSTYSVLAVLSHLKSLAKLEQFPTPYAAENMEEHFCESLSMYCLGTLTGSNLEAFRRIVFGEA